MASVVVRINASALRTFTNSGGDVNKDMQRRSLRVLSQAQINAPVRTGRMRASGLSQPATGYPVGAWEVAFPVGYSYYQDQGTRYMRGRFYLTNALPSAI